MRRVLDLLFPLECVACGASGAHACLGCLALIPSAPRVFEEGVVKSASGFSYANPIVRRLLHDAKYESWSCAIGPLEVLTRRGVAMTGGVLPACAVVMAVPLHASRLRARGFNQAEALARAVASATGRSSAEGFLVRVRHTRPQTETRDRVGNVRGAFICRRLPPSLVGRTFLLVDDVRTSGATMRGCAEALRDAGAGPVYGFALAWGSDQEEKAGT